MTKSLLIISLFLLASCLKTAEQVQREKKMAEIPDQVQSSQKMMSDLLIQMKDLRAQMNTLNGRIEELEYKQGQTDPEKEKKSSETMNLIQNQQTAQATQLEEIKAELKEQRAFLEKVTSSLKNISSGDTKKKSAKSELTSALSLVSANKYSEARKELEALIGNSELTAGDTNKLYHGLGRTEFYTKNYDKALVYFSKIYTKYPKASLAPSSLLFIARSLSKLGKKDEAKEAFDQVTSQYAGSKEAEEAKKEM